MLTKESNVFTDEGGEEGTPLYPRFVPMTPLLQGDPLLPVQSPRARCFEKPKLRTSESGEREVLLIEQVPAEKVGALGVSWIHPKKVQSSGFVQVQGRVMKGLFLENSSLRQNSSDDEHVCVPDKAEAVGLEAVGTTQARTGWR